MTNGTDHTTATSAKSTTMTEIVVEFSPAS
jgi:hypothetical protein